MAPITNQYVGGYNQGQAPGAVPMSRDAYSSYLASNGGQPRTSMQPPAAGQPPASNGGMPGADQTAAAGVNAGQGQPNLDPGKMARPRQGTALAAPAPSSQQGFDAYGQYLQGRAQGNRTSADIENEGNAASQMRDQLQATARKNLQQFGFAPASALGLSYANDVDRQVGALMNERETQQQQQAQTDFMNYLSQGAQRQQFGQQFGLAQQAQQNQVQQFGQSQAQQAQQFGQTLGEKQQEFQGTQQMTQQQLNEKKQNDILSFISNLFG